MKFNFGLPKSPKQLIYYFAKINGVAPFILKDDKFHPPNFINKFYPLVFIINYIIFILMTFSLIIDDIYKDDFPQFIKMITTATYVLTIPCSIMTQAVFLLMNKKVVYLMNELCIFGKEMKSLGIEENHKKFFKNICLNTITTNAVFVTVCFTICLLNSYWKTLPIIKLFINNGLSFNAILIFAQILICVRQRFTLLYENLFHLLIPTVHRRIYRRSQIVVVNRNNLSRLERLRKIKFLHAKLCGLLKKIIDIFEIPIIFNSFRFSHVLMLSAFWLYKNSVKTSCNAMPFSSINTMSILFVGLRISITITGLVTMIHASATTSKQANYMKVMLFETWIKAKAPELDEEFLAFSNQLSQMPVTVSAFGSLDLGYAFMFKIFCFTTTYFTIMIQFENSQPPPLCD